jgi:putative FmdB family regulatory protein
MPIYEYRCTACEHELETLRKISDPPLTLCPACHTENLRKRVSAAAFRLKGGGWYETDFKTSGQKNLAGEGSAPTKDSGSASNTKSEAKTESKSEVKASAKASTTSSDK